MGVVVGVYGDYRLHFVAPEHHTHYNVLVSEPDVDGIALDAERSAPELHLAAAVERRHELAQELVARYLHAARHRNHVFVEILGVAHAVETRHRRHHNDIAPPRQQRRSGGKAQAVDFVVDHQVFLDILVDRRYIGLRLIVIVVRHEVLHGVFGEKLLEFAVELRRQSLVMAEYERGTLHLLYDIGHSEGLARTGDAKQRLRLAAGLHTLGKLPYGLRLVAGGLVLRT